MTKLLILVYADKQYEDFVIPYIYYASEHNNDVKIEVILDHYEDFVARNSDGIDALKGIVGESFLLRQSSYSQSDVLPNTIRFLEVPRTQSEYIYIGDIDILILDDILGVHLPFVEKHNLPFSNAIRQSKDSSSPKRLTGLHLCKTNKYYPLPDLSDIDLLSTNDEHVLYRIMLKKGLMIPDSVTFRPICGIHMSLNRDPIGRYSLNNRKVNLHQKSVSWGAHKYNDKYLKSIFSPEYGRLSVYFTVKYKFLALVIESLAKKQFGQLQRDSFLYGFDKFLIADDTDFNYERLLDEVTKYSERREYPNLIKTLKKMITIWSDDLALYRQLSDAYLAIGDITSAERITDFIDN